MPRLPALTETRLSLRTGVDSPISPHYRWRAACDVMTVDLDGEFRASGESRRLTSMATDMSGLAWTPDGKGLVYGSGIARYVHHLWRVTIDGRHPPERLEVAGLGARRPQSCRHGTAWCSSAGRSIWTSIVSGPRHRRARRLCPPTPTSMRRSLPTDLASSTPPHDRAQMADIWVAGDDGSIPQQLTRDMSGFHAAPRWSPDGRVIAFASRAVNGRSDIWTIEPDGGNRRQITTGSGEKLYPSWSGDGAWYLLHQDEGAGPNIWRIAATGGRDVQLTRGGGYAGLSRRTARASCTRCDRTEAEHRS